MIIQKFLKPEKSNAKLMQSYSHGCLIDFPDCLSAINPMNHTKTKANEVNPKKIST